MTTSTTRAIQGSHQKAGGHWWRQHLLALAFLLCAATLLLAPTHAQTIATGARHGLALQADGSVLAWGARCMPPWRAR